MCGIAGVLRFDGGPVAPERLQAMTGSVAYRGPDDEGFFHGPGIGLGMRRLAIIDLANGRQPVPNEDGSVQVVLNGEIYNFRELRAELEGRHRFRSDGDTEVIAHLYEERGAACVDALRGMFALAVWDEGRRRLLLARDRIGIKPLYYALTPEELLFGSELKVVLAAGGLSRAIDGQALAHLLAFGTTPHDRSIVAGVRKLEPGHLLEASSEHGVSVRRYWRLRFEPDRARTPEAWIAALREALAESVRLHMVSDVPLGAFLSGGVDSGCVVAAMARADPAPIRTFSIGFRESGYDELPYAQLLAERLGTRHTVAVLEPRVMEALEDVAYYLDEPFGDSSAIPTFMVSELAASEVTVVLSGDGGDELFAGYDRYRVEERERRRSIVPAPLKRFLGAVGDALPAGTTGRELLRHLRLSGSARYLDASTLFDRGEREGLLEPDVARAAGGLDPSAHATELLDDGELHWLSALQRLDIESYLPLDILTKVDRMSMAHSLEARVPLLDHRLVELAARIPPELLLREGAGKWLFKRALEGWLPAPILERPKQGFAIPLGHWFRGQLGPYVRGLLLSERSRRRGLFRPSAVARLIELHEAGRPLDLHLFTLISIELWCRTFLDGARAPAGAGRRHDGARTAARTRADARAVP